MPELDLALTRPERVSVTNPVSGDLFIQENGDCLVLDDVDTEVQAIQIRCYTFKGEVYTDEEAGVPWFQYILGNKLANPSVIKGFFRKEILARGSVVDVPKLEYSFDGTTREATISFEGLLASGQVIGADYTEGVL